MRNIFKNVLNKAARFARHFCWPLLTRFYFMSFFAKYFQLSDERTISLTTVFPMLTHFGFEVESEKHFESTVIIPVDGSAVGAAATSEAAASVLTIICTMVATLAAAEAPVASQFIHES